VTAYVGVDVGGTKTLAVRTSRAGEVLARSRATTRAADEDDLIGGIVALVREVSTPDVAGLGVGLPGLVSIDGVLAYAPLFPFGPAPVATRLRTALGLPTVCDNDANCATWAEARSPLGTTALVTVGTGLGCGMVAGGRLLRGAHGYAAEVSHLIVNPGGEACSCGQYGCLGIEATGYAIAQRARRCGVEESHWGPAALTGEAVTAAAERGDPVSIEILTRTGELLGYGLAAIANLLDPDVLIVGGGAAGPLLLDAARPAFAERLYAAGARPLVPLELARLANDAGAIGAALLGAEAAGA
jgi:glucokinase